MENKRKRTIAVIDLKAFYAYVECLDRGLDPWKAPLIVADKERGKNTIILSVSPYPFPRCLSWFPAKVRISNLSCSFLKSVLISVLEFSQKTILQSVLLI